MEDVLPMITAGLSGMGSLSVRSVGSLGVRSAVEHCLACAEP